MYETYKAKEFGNGDEDDHLCTGMIEKMEEDTKEKKLPNYYGRFKGQEWGIWQKAWVKSSLSQHTI